MRIIKSRVVGAYCVLMVRYVATFRCTRRARKTKNRQQKAFANEKEPGNTFQGIVNKMYGKIRRLLKFENVFKGVVKSLKVFSLRFVPRGARFRVCHANAQKNSGKNAIERSQHKAKQIKFLWRCRVNIWLIAFFQIIHWVKLYKIMQIILDFPNQVALAYHIYCTVFASSEKLCWKKYIGFLL